MATLDQLTEQGRITKVDPNEFLAPHELPERSIYLSEGAKVWITTTLPELVTDGYVSGANRPLEQVFNSFRDYLSGVPASDFAMAPMRLRPGQHGVWELRTPDIRVFGAFHRPNIFIATTAMSKRQAMKRNNSGYKKAMDETLHFIGSLGLPPPPITIGDMQDVITV